MPLCFICSELIELDNELNFFCIPFKCFFGGWGRGLGRETWQIPSCLDLMYKL